jgi:hypothetical protein
MEQTENLKFPKHLDHLNKTFLEELNYKLWVTKGARFKADERLTKKDELSSISISFLTAYLIIFGLIGVYQSTTAPFIATNIINFGTTAGSILILIFSQLESAKCYKLEAHKYLVCALEISALYDQIRMRKTLINENKNSDYEFCKDIDSKYNYLLNKYPNHKSVDYEMFMLEKCNFFPVSNFQKIWLPIKHYVKTSALYYGLIVIPPIYLIIYYLIKW